MKSLSSASVWIIIFLVVIFLFMSYKQQDHPDKLTLMDWMGKADEQLIIGAIDRGGKIEGKYIKDKKQGVEAAYVTEYLPGQEPEILKFVRESQERARENKDPKLA